MDALVNSYSNTGAGALSSDLSYSGSSYSGGSYGCGSGSEWQVSAHHSGCGRSHGGTSIAAAPVTPPPPAPPLCDTARAALQPCSLNKQFE